jgi:hypothetical protein
VRESWGSTKPKGEVKVKAALLWLRWDLACWSAHHRLVPFVFKGATQERTRWDPKDGELCLRRSKPEETLVEDRSVSDVQIDRQT